MQSPKLEQSRSGLRHARLQLLGLLAGLSMRVNPGKGLQQW
jgi:hypothetical protein